MDIIKETCAIVGVAPKFLIRRAVEAQHFTNEREVQEARIAEYEQSGTFPDYVRTYCLKQQEIQKAVNTIREAQAKPPRSYLGTGTT